MLYLLRTVKQAVSCNSRYEKLGFYQNPFPFDARVKFNSDNKLENGTIYLAELRLPEQAAFEKILTPGSAEAESGKIAWLLDMADFAGRGVGRTAFINHQIKVINEDLGNKISNGLGVMFALYTRPGGEKRTRKPWQMNKIIIEAMAEQGLFWMAWCRLRFLLRGDMIPQEVINKIDDSNLKFTIGNDNWLQKEIGINKLAAFNRHVKTVLDREGIKEELIENLMQAGAEGSSFYQDLLNGRNDAYWMDNASKYLFNDIVKFLRLAGFTDVIILFDDFEKVITAQNFHERRAFCDSLRYYFTDSSCENARYSFFKIVLAIDGYSQELLIPHWNASGLNRLLLPGGEENSSNTIFFKPYPITAAAPLAREYMKYSRKNNGTLDGIAPFTQKALELALKKAEGIPGKFLYFLYQAVEKAVSNEWMEIGTAEIERVIEEDSALKRLTSYKAKAVNPLADGETLQ